MPKALATARQLEVVRLHWEGRSSREVAEEMGLSKRTVDYHLNEVYRRLRVNTLVAACRILLRSGLLLP